MMWVKLHTSPAVKNLNYQYVPLMSSLTNTKHATWSVKVSPERAMLNHADWKIGKGGGACRSPDWATGSAVDSALVEREWRRDAAGTEWGLVLHDTNTLLSQAAKRSHSPTKPKSYPTTRDKLGNKWPSSMTEVTCTVSICYCKAKWQAAEADW